MPSPPPADCWCFGQFLIFPLIFSGVYCTVRTKALMVYAGAMASGRLCDLPN